MRQLKVFVRILNLIFQCYYCVKLLFIDSVLSMKLNSLQYRGEINVFYNFSSTEEYSNYIIIVWVTGYTLYIVLLTD